MNDGYLPLSDQQAIERQYDDAVVRLAMQKIAREGLARFESMYSTPEIEAACQRHRLNTNSFINRTIKKASYQPKKRSSAKLGWIAAAAMVLLLAGMTSAIAFIPTVRHTILKLLIAYEEDYTELRLVEDLDSAFDVPAAWPGQYFPSYIPEGFVFNENTSLSMCSRIVYMNGGSMLVFSEYSRDTTLQINTEGMNIDTIEILGEEAHCAFRQDKTVVYWLNYENYFVIEFDGPKDIALRIARSVVRLSK